MDTVWTAAATTADMLSHNCGRPVDNRADNTVESTLTGTDGVHGLWI